MATCGTCIEVITENQQITCLTCKKNFHLKCAKEMMENGTIVSCSRYKNVTRRKTISVKSKSHKSLKSVTSRASSKARLELELLDRKRELQKRQFAEMEELLRKKHESEIEFLNQQTLLLQKVDEENTSNLSVGESIDKVNEWIKQTDGVAYTGNTQLEGQQNRENVKSAIQQQQSIGQPLLSTLSGECVAARKVIQKELPKFSGKSNEWPFFVSVYESTTKACGFSNEENLSRLRNCLEGSAYEAVKSYLMFPDLVPRVIDTLKKIFWTTRFHNE